MKNPYVLAVYDTAKFVVFVALAVFALDYLGTVVGAETAREIFYGVLALVVLFVFYMINVARRKFYQLDKN
jgi:uncharacterized membrane protein (DUF485 family)